MPSESDGGNDSHGTSGASSSARGGDGGGDGGDGNGWGAYGGAGWSTQGYTTGEPASGDDGDEGESTTRSISEQLGWTSQPSPNVSPASNPAAATHDLNTTTGSVSPGGLSYAEVRAMQSADRGDEEGTNPNNPTQTVDQVLASDFVHKEAMPVAIGLLQSAVPGASLAMNAVKRIGAVTTGQQTIGQALGNYAVDTVGNYAAAKINGAINSATDGLYGQAGLISSSFGLGLPNIGREVVNGVVNSTGIRPGGMQGIGSPAADNGIGNGADNNPNIPQTPTTPNVPTTPTAATPAVPYENIDINMWGGMTPEKWAAAAKKLNISFGGWYGDMA